MMRTSPLAVHVAVAPGAFIRAEGPAPLADTVREALLVDFPLVDASGHARRKSPPRAREAVLIDCVLNEQHFENTDLKPRDLRFHFQANEGLLGL